MAASVGSLWLQEHFKLSKHQLSHRSHIGAREKIELSSVGIVDQTFRSKYTPDIQDPLHHIEFSLKYDDLSLEFLQAVFKKNPCCRCCGLLLKQAQLAGIPRALDFYMNF
jgi:hypothetical protein